MSHPRRPSRGVVRIIAAALAIGVLGLVPSAIGAGPKPKRPEVGAPRILYSSDWSGTSEIYAVDPSASPPVGQLTFGRPPVCGPSVCAYTNPIPSPDGRRLLFYEYGGCSGKSMTVDVARADGTLRRPVAQAKYHCAVPWPSAVWAPDSRRLAYVIDGAVGVVRVDGSQRRVLGRGSNPAWSSGGVLAFLAGSTYNGGDLVVFSKDGSHRIVDTARSFAWSPDGTWIVYQRWSGSGPFALYLVHPDGSGRRRLAISGVGPTPSWSSDGRFVAFPGKSGLSLADVKTGEVRGLEGYSAYLVAWSPTGHGVALLAKDGLYFVDPVTGSSRLLTHDSAIHAAWSPDGRTLAYLAPRPRLGSVHVYDSGEDLKVATVSGQVQTVVSATGHYGGYVSGIVWTRPPAGLRYRAAVPRSIATVSTDQLTAPWPIERLVTDGTRVAYVSCGHVFVWTPQTKGVLQADPVASMSPSCPLGDYYTPFRVFTLALAGDRLAFGAQEGNMSKYCWLGGTPLTPQPEGFDLWSSGPGCFAGNLAGSSGLLVFSNWQLNFNGHPYLVKQETIRRADPGGCPCIELRIDQGPLVPYDVDADRIVAGGQNATVILDSSGKQLLSVPVSPLAAQLSNSHLVVLVQGALREYNADSGTLVHSWPLPDVPGGSDCQMTVGDFRDCPTARLLLEDAAHGLVAYVLDGQVRLIRLSDGKDAVVAAGTLARFMDAGLVYADGSHLHLVPFAALPLH